MEIPYTVERREDTGLYNAKLAVWLFLASEVMLFGALFSAYVLLRVGAPDGYWPHGLLNVPVGAAKLGGERVNYTDMYEVLTAPGYVPVRTAEEEV